MRKIKEKSIKNKTYGNIVIFNLVTIVALIIVLFIFSLKANAEGSGEDYPAPENGTWTIVSETNIWNETIILNGNLTIEEEGVLIFKNVTFIINCTYDGEFGIIVNENGKFHILDYDNDPDTLKDKSIITAFNSAYEYRFLVKSNTEFEMKNSELSECGYSMSGTDGKMGLTIKTDNTIIENSSIFNNERGIYYYFSDNNKLINNNIYFNNRQGIYIFNSNNNQILNNKVYNNDASIWIYMFSSRNQIKNNSLYSNNYGIFLNSVSDNYIINNYIYSNYYSIYFGSSHINQVNNNIFSNNSYVLYITSSTGNQITNSTISNSFIYDFYLNPNSEIMVINTTFNNNKVYLGDENSMLIVMWYLHVNVVDKYYISKQNARVIIENLEGGELYKDTTGPDGWTRWILCIDYIKKNTQTILHTPHTINASYETAFGVQSIKMNQSRFIEITIDDNIKPKIFNVKLSNITYNSTIIKWQTNEPCYSLLKYTEDNSWLEWEDISDYDKHLKTSHSIEIIDLESDTTYYFNLNSTDAYNNTNESSGKFDTLKQPKQKISIVITLFDDYFLTNSSNYKINIFVSNSTTELGGVDLEFGTIIEGNIEKIGEGSSASDGNYTLYFDAPLVIKDTKLIFWVNANMIAYQPNNDSKKDIWIRVINVSKVEKNFINKIKVTVLAGYIGEGNLSLDAKENPGSNNYKNIDVFFYVNFSGKDLYWINITINYKEDLLPENINVKNLKIYWWNNETEKWVENEKTDVNENVNYIWANVTHLMVFAPRDEKAKPPIQEEEKYPDLIVNNIELSNTKPMIGEKITITAIIKNVGDGIATNFIVRFNVDENKSHVIVNLTLDINETKKLTFDWIPTEGNHTITILIENCKPNESNTNNNQEKISVYVESEKKKDKDFIPSTKTIGLGTTIGIGVFVTFFLAGTEVGKYNFLLFFLPLYTKLKKKDLENQVTRNQIIGFLKAKPGATFTEIKKKLGLKNGSAAHHLEKLEKGNIIKSVRQGKYKRFYPIPMIPPTAERILNIIKEYPGITQNEIIKKTKISQPLISYHLKLIIRDGKVIIDRKGRQKTYKIIEIVKKAFRNCPFCGEDFNMEKTPTFCPYCKEKLK